MAGYDACVRTRQAKRIGSKNSITAHACLYSVNEYVKYVVLYVNKASESHDGVLQYHMTARDTVAAKTSAQARFRT